MKKVFGILFLFFSFLVCLDNVSAEILEDGIYEIETALASNKVIDLHGGATRNGTNIEIYERNNGNNQKWVVSHLKDDYYTISSFIDDGKFADVAGNGKSNGTNVLLWQKNDGENQQWILKDAGDGYYNIISKSSNLYLDIYDGKSINGSNVIVWEGNGGKNQKFKFIKMQKGEKTLNDGVYTINSALDNTKFINSSGLIDNGANVNIFDDTKLLNQKWTVKYLNNGYYSISSYVNDNFVFDVAGASFKTGSNVGLWNNNGGANQQWIIKDAGDGYYNIISKNGWLYLDICGGKSVNGTNVIVWSGNGGNNQKFKFNSVEIGDKSLEDGNYYISSGLIESKVLSASGESSGANVYNNIVSNKNTQKWTVKYLNNGYYSLTLASDDTKSLDVYAGANVRGTNVELFTSNNADNQQWLIEDAGDGYYYIISKCNRLYLDIGGSSLNNGANVAVWDGNNGKNQKFKFTEIITGDKSIEDGVYTISSALDSNMVVGLDLEMPFNGAKLQLESFLDLDSQKWYVNYLEDGYYKITSALSGGKVVDSPNYSFVNGTTLGLFTDNGGANQQWIIKDAGDGYYNIVSSYNFMNFDINGNAASENASIEIETANDSNSQKFKLTEANLNGNNRVIEDGYYVIESALDSSKVLDIHGALKLNGTNVELYNSNNGNNQIWYFKYLNNGFYTITSALNPIISLDVHASGMTNGTNIEIYKANDGDNQKWAIRDVGNGYYSIISKVNGLSVNVVNSNNGANAQMNKINNTVNQRFKLRPVTFTKKYTGLDISAYQTSINWEQVAKSNLGFIIIRAGFGGDWTKQDDTRFKDNVAACEKYNIPYGIYLYSYAKNANGDDVSAQAEAKHVLRLLNEIGFYPYYYKPTLGTKVFIDIEDKSVASAGKNNLTAVANQFCDIMEKSGYACGVYASKNWLTYNLDTKTLVSKYDIWLAEWGGNNKDFNWALQNSPTYNLTPFKYWQFTSNGSFTGITGRVDSNIGYDIFD